VSFIFHLQLGYDMTYLFKINPTQIEINPTQLKNQPNPKIKLNFSLLPLQLSPLSLSSCFGQPIEGGQDI
jgi:hypothetical protein